MFSFTDTIPCRLCALQMTRKFRLNTRTTYNFLITYTELTLNVQSLRRDKFFTASDIVKQTIMYVHMMNILAGLNFSVGHSLWHRILTRVYIAHTLTFYRLCPLPKFRSQTELCKKHEEENKNISVLDDHVTTLGENSRRNLPHGLLCIRGLQKRCKAWKASYL